MTRGFKSLGIIGLFAGLSSFAGAASMTMNGMISDSACGTSHAKMIGTSKMTEKECTLACVKAGAKFVFVSRREGLQHFQSELCRAHQERRGGCQSDR